MSTSSRISSTTRRAITMAFGLLLVAIAMLVAAHPAGAQPVGGGNGEPTNIAPVPRFTISPNPAVANEQPVLVAKGKGVHFVPPGGIDRVGSGDVVKFNGAASTDDGDIVKYAWDLDGNGTFEVSGTSAKTQRSYDTAGTYNVRLRVTDDQGASRIIGHQLIVHRAPHPAISATPTVALVGQAVALSAVGSSADSSIVKYEWDLDGNGTFETDTGTTFTTSATFQSIGTRNLKLRVTDNYGVSRTASVDVVVHRAPTAAFTFAPSPATVGETVTFDASSSSDDGAIKKYEWDLDGNGTFETDTLTVPTVKKAYDTPQAIVIGLRVTDDHGVTDTVVHALAVNPKPTTTTTTTTDKTAPVVQITPRSVHMSKRGNVAIVVACPASERLCAGRLSLRKLGVAHSSALGGASFALGGGQRVTLHVHLSKTNRRAVRRLHRLSARATAIARDAAGNTGASRALVTIKR